MDLLLYQRQKNHTSQVLNGRHSKGETVRKKARSCHQSTAASLRIFECGGGRSHDFKNYLPHFFSPGISVTLFSRYRGYIFFFDKYLRKKTKNVTFPGGRPPPPPPTSHRRRPCEFKQRPESKTTKTPTPPYRDRDVCERSRRPARRRQMAGHNPHPSERADRPPDRRQHSERANSAAVSGAPRRFCGQSGGWRGRPAPRGI